MGTSNFRYQPTLPTVVIDYEPDADYYRQEYPGADEDEIQSMMLADEDFFWRDLENEVRPEVEDINDDLIFHEVELVGGYYSGMQLYVKEPDPKYLVHDLRYDWEMEYGDDPSSDQRLYTAYMRERDRLVDWLQGMCDRHGFRMYGVAARFSNGETWYAPLPSGNSRGRGKTKTGRSKGRLLGRLARRRRRDARRTWHRGRAPRPRRATRRGGS